AQFDEVLPFARHAAGRLARRDTEHDDENQREHDREQERIQVQHPEAAGFRIDAHRVQIQLEVGQVVQDVAAGVVGAFSRHVPKESSCAIQRPISCRARSAVQSRRPQLSCRPRSCGTSAAITPHITGKPGRPALTIVKYRPIAITPHLSMLPTIIPAKTIPADDAPAANIRSASTLVATATTLPPQSAASPERKSAKANPAATSTVTPSCAQTTRMASRRPAAMEFCIGTVQL